MNNANDDFLRSIKMMQSEAGVIGEASNNIEMVGRIIVELSDRFDHTHGTVTGSDTFLFVSELHLGNRIDNGHEVLQGYMARKGCNENIVSILSKAIIRDWRLFDLMQQALLVAHSIRYNKPSNGE